MLYFKHFNYILYQQSLSWTWLTRTSNVVKHRNIGIYTQHSRFLENAYWQTGLEFRYSQIRCPSSARSSVRDIEEGEDKFREVYGSGLGGRFSDDTTAYY